jgi:hypothetical protein
MMPGELCAKVNDGICAVAVDDSGIRVGPMRIDRESLPVSGKFLIRYRAFVLTQNRELGVS